MNSGPLRVVHIITRLDRGGSAENTLMTAAGLDPERFAVAVVHGLTQGSRSPTETRARAQGVPFIELPCLVRQISPWQDLRALASLWRLLRRGRYQIAHTHTSKAGLLGRVAARLARVPVVVHTPHGHVFYGYCGLFLSRLFVYLERWAAEFTDRLVALTGADAAEHVRFGVAGPRKIAVIHSGVDFSAWAVRDPGRDQVRRSLGLDPHDLVVGTLGRLTAVKAQDDLVRAFARVRQQVGNARLLLAGDGEEGEALAALAGSLGVADRVVFAGWRPDVADVLRAMDVFAFPSLNEGMGKALVEAMYTGLAVVATRVGGIPELVEDGVNGLLVPPRRPDLLAEALQALAGDPQRRRRLGEAAARRAQGYSATAMVEKIEALYEAVWQEKTSGMPSPSAP